MIGNSNKCFSPWFGFMVIVVVCVVIAGAVFVETRGSQRRRARKHPKPAAAMAPVVPATSVTGTTTDGKVLF